MQKETVEKCRLGSGGAGGGGRGGGRGSLSYCDLQFSSSAVPGQWPKVTLQLNTSLP